MFTSKWAEALSQWRLDKLVISQILSCIIILLLYIYIKTEFYFLFIPLESRCNGNFSSKIGIFFFFWSKPEIVIIDCGLRTVELKWILVIGELNFFPNRVKGLSTRCKLFLFLFLQLVLIFSFVKGFGILNCRFLFVFYQLWRNPILLEVLINQYGTCFFSFPMFYGNFIRWILVFFLC